ncbi:MAG: hypothetical protein WBF83_06705 [Moheibacter sp.]
MQEFGVKSADELKIEAELQTILDPCTMYQKQMDRLAYITGYAIAFIGTMFIPIAGWVGKIAKIDRLIPDELLTLLKTQGTNLAKQFKTKTRNARLKNLTAVS